MAVAQNLDQIGVTALRATTTNLDGSGVRVAQPEASLSTNSPIYEVNPGAVGQPTNLFTYYSALGAATGFTNAVGAESDHANAVGANFYGMTGIGVATNVAHVDNFDADYFINTYIVSNLVMLTDAVVNQSFTFGNVSTNLPTPPNTLSVGEQQMIDSVYDDYAATNGTIFVSAVNNQGSVSPPGTAYNCIGVAAFGGSSSVGPTLDNGRCKPDITAPAGVTSFSTPQVSGAAALLLQAALRGDGGDNTNSAADLRTVKALLLNGAVKPPGWTNSSSSPLDPRFGAGVLNILNSYEQLAGSMHNFIDSGWLPAGAAHPPSGAAGTIGQLSGWDFNSLVSLGHPDYDAVNHYLFNASNGVATATLVWNRQNGQTNINNLFLFLYNCANSNLVACSTSLVDNVEHLYVPQLGAGRYDLQVWKPGGTNTVSSGENYALAWEFVSPSLAIARSGTNLTVTWPVYPAGFVLEGETNLSAGAWSTNNLPAAVITNGQNWLRLDTAKSGQFFRLHQP
jgi:hypothetical protein